MPKQNKWHVLGVEIQLLQHKNQVIGNIFRVLERKSIEIAHLSAIKDHQVEQFFPDMDENTVGVDPVFIVNPDAKGYVIGIQGSMGVGKTKLIKDGIAKVLKYPFAFIPLGGISDSSYLKGHLYTYEGSTYGKIVDEIIKAKVMNPIFFFDNDNDGLMSFLLLQRYIGRGKGVVIRSFPDLNVSYYRKVVELKPQAEAEARAQAGKTRTRDSERSANSPDISGEGRNAQGDGRQVD
jgi:hypothetical protein